MSLLPREGKTGHFSLAHMSDHQDPAAASASLLSPPRVPPARGTAPAAGSEVQFPAQMQECGKAAVFAPQGCGEEAELPQQPFPPYSHPACTPSSSSSLGDRGSDCRGWQWDTSRSRGCLSQTLKTITSPSPDSAESAEVHFYNTWVRAALLPTSFRPSFWVIYSIRD